MWILILWGKGQLEDLGYIYLMLKIAHILMPIEYFFEFLNNWLQIDFLSLFPFYFLNFTCFGTLLVRKQASIRLWAPQGRGGFLSTSSGHTEHRTWYFAGCICRERLWAHGVCSAEIQLGSSECPCPAGSWGLSRPSWIPSSLCLSLHSGCSADLGGPADPLHVLEGVVAAVHASVDEG